MDEAESSSVFAFWLFKGDCFPVGWVLNNFWDILSNGSGSLQQYKLTTQLLSFQANNNNNNNNDDVIYIKMLKRNRQRICIYCSKHHQTFVKQGWTLVLFLCHDVICILNFTDHPHTVMPWIPIIDEFVFTIGRGRCVRRFQMPM
jgi:hypothetical protein